jgi:hypothetical protein
MSHAKNVLLQSKHPNVRKTSMGDNKMTTANEVKKKNKDREGWQYDLTICPDCHTNQKTVKEEDDNCENEDCDSFVTMYKRNLIWWNENWG